MNVLVTIFCKESQGVTRFVNNFKYAM